MTSTGILLILQLQSESCLHLPSPTALLKSKLRQGTGELYHCKLGPSLCLPLPTVLLKSKPRQGTQEVHHGKLGLCLCSPSPAALHKCACDRTRHREAASLQISFISLFNIIYSSAQVLVCKTGQGTGERHHCTTRDKQVDWLCAMAFHSACVP